MFNIFIIACVFVITEGTSQPVANIRISPYKLLRCKTFLLAQSCPKKPTAHVLLQLFPRKPGLQWQLPVLSQYAVFGW